MDADNKNTLPDVQSARDGRNIAIDRVGVRGITVPITVETKEDTRRVHEHRQCQEQRHNP